MKDQTSIIKIVYKGLKYLRMFYLLNYAKKIDLI